MRTELPGSDLGFTIPLVRDGEPFVPDNGTVNWSLRGQDGSVMVNPTQIAGITDTQVQLTVPEANNTVAAGLSFEKRVIFITGTLAGSPFTIRMPYKLVAWANFTASEDDVRALIGVDVSELPDADIDLTTAYLDVAGVLTTDILNTALASGTANEVSANRAITARAALNTIPSMQARLLKSQSDGSQDIDRFQIDFDQLLVDVRDRLAKNLLDLTPSTKVVAYSPSGTSTNADPFTGV